jgi:iron only hydrogenase large subunit-like protein
MVACGRSIKKVHPDARTVFIGPCIAKKSEAKEPDIRDAVDFVLTFQEVAEIFDVAGINPADMTEDMKDHSSTSGRIYARTGGVSEAVSETVKRLFPNHTIPLVARQGNGVPECKAMLEHIMSGDIDANFMEGMGCRGGCVGGPKAILSVEEGTRNVNEYGETAAYKTPVDNPYVMEMLSRLGFDSVESLLENDNYFIRHLGI